MASKGEDTAIKAMEDHYVRKSVEDADLREVPLRGTQFKGSEQATDDGTPFGAAEEEFPVCESFQDMPLHGALLHSIHTRGFEQPTAIQQRAISAVVGGRDTIAVSQCGTGKTAAFLVGALQLIDYSRRACQAMVLAPTRDLAQQIHREAVALGEPLGLRAHACVGGTLRREDAEFLKTGPHLVVGTPGRLLDLLQRRDLRSRNLKLLVLDEADEMLSRGFKDQVKDIFKLIPAEVQVCLFSATMPPSILEMTTKFMRDPVRISARKEQPTLEGVQQFYVDVDQEEWKLDILCDLYEQLTITQAIVYGNSRRKVETLAHELRKRDFTVSVMHSEMTQHERGLAMQDFRSGAARALLSTDLLARGVDVEQVSLVLNYDMPTSAESYLHRVGRRGGCAGRKGVAISFVTRRDAHQVEAFRQHFATQIEELPNDIADRM